MKRVILFAFATFILTICCTHESQAQDYGYCEQLSSATNWRCKAYSTSSQEQWGNTAFYVNGITGSFTYTGNMWTGQWGYAAYHFWGDCDDEQGDINQNSSTNIGGTLTFPGSNPQWVDAQVYAKYGFSQFTVNW